MTPIKFKQQNITYTAPTGMTEEQCGDLPAYRGGGEIISCWKLSWRERLKIFFTGVIWLSVLADQQPPICLSVNTFFEEEDK